MEKLNFWNKPERQVFAIEFLTTLCVMGLLVSDIYNRTNLTLISGFYLLQVGLVAVAAMFTVLLSISIMMRSGKWPPLQLTQVGISFACLGLLSVSYTFPLSVPLLASNLIIAVLLSVMALSIHELTMQILEPQKSERTSTLLLMCVLLVATGAWELNASALQGIEDTSLRLARWVYLILLINPYCVQAIHAFAKHQNQHQAIGRPRNLRLEVAQNFPDRERLLKWHWSMSLVNFLILQCMLSTSLWRDPYFSWSGTQILWATASLQAFPALMWTLRSWRAHHRLPRRIRSNSVVDLKKAASLLEQHHYGHETQSETWLGYRTAVLMIDHDPNEECRAQLPSFLYRARQIQCQTMMETIFSKQITSLNSSGSQLTLAIDPEKTLANCTEALLILTTLYLDGLPLIEKRLKHLVRLLPLLDPDLGRSLTEARMEALFSRLQGFFHLDFSWIDQSMHSDIDEAQIEIRLENLNPKERSQVFSQLSAAQWLGNFVWISEAAREQLRSESPYLASTIERWPIQIEQGQGRPLESAIFLIKFENLIPRLQHYFGLNDIRSRLAARPVSESTQALVDQLAESLEKIGDSQSLAAALELIGKHDWQGFKAKDVALDLMLKYVAHAESLGESQRIRKDQLSEIKSQARTIVQEIGYPSQNLHAAHMKKLELRQLGELQRICLDISNPRCFEAWLLLASLPTRRMGQISVTQLLQMIASASQKRNLRRHDFIMRKAIETYFQLARTLPVDREQEMHRVANMLAQAVLEEHATAPLMLHFMDKKLALDFQRGHYIPLDVKILSRWERALTEITAQGTIDATMKNALDTRWKSFCKNATDATAMAS